MSLCPGSLATGLTMTPGIRVRTTIMLMVLMIHAFIEGFDDDYNEQEGLDDGEDGPMVLMTTTMLLRA